MDREAWWATVHGVAKSRIRLNDFTRYYLFPGASQVVLIVKNPSTNAGDLREVSLIPESGRSPGEGNGNPLQYSCLENRMDGEAWWATVHGVAKSRTRLSNFIFFFIFVWWARVEKAPGCLVMHRSRG